MYQIAFLVLAIASLNAIVFTLLKKGAVGFDKTTFSLGNIMTLLPQIFFNIYILSSLALLGISFVVWLFLLSKNQVSKIYPITIGMNFVLLFIIARIFLKESLSLLQIIGVAVILIGIFLISR